MDEEIEVAPSADNGNVPADAPSEQPKEQVPAVVEPAQPAEPVVEMFDLPDGRKVDAATLSKEWKENFAPEFTRKSQALAEIEKAKDPIINKTPEKPYQDPNWQPQTYAELIEISKQELKADLAKDQQAKIEQEKALEDAVTTQLTELKTADPTLNENALFLHATKYGFRDLKLAHQNMKDMSQLVKTVQKTTADNITKRVDPVSINPGAGGQKLDPSQFERAVDYLRALKGTA